MPGDGQLFSSRSNARLRGCDSDYYIATANSRVCEVEGTRIRRVYCTSGTPGDMRSDRFLLISVALRRSGDGKKGTVILDLCDCSGRMFADLENRSTFLAFACEGLRKTTKHLCPDRD